MKRPSALWACCLWACWVFGLVFGGLEVGGGAFIEAASDPNHKLEWTLFAPSNGSAMESETPRKPASSQPSQEPVLIGPHLGPPSVDGPSLAPEKIVPGQIAPETHSELKIQAKSSESPKNSPFGHSEKNTESKQFEGNSKDGPDLEKPEKPTPLFKPSLGPEWKALAEGVQRAIRAASKIPMNTRDHTPAELVQWALLWGCEAEAAYGGPGGQTVNVLAILCHNYPCAERQLLVKHDGHFAARFGYGYQTQRGQFLAVLAWARVPKDYPLQVGQETRTVADLVEYEKLHCRSGLDQSQVLLGLSFYLEKQEETSWQNNLGEAWSLERLLSEELKGPISGAADGGLHRLMGLSYAVQTHRKRDRAWTPPFQQAHQYLLQYQKHAFRCQNEDGTWNPAFLEAVGPSKDTLGTLRATGHIFRWLAFSVSEAELYDPRMFKAARALLGLMDARRSSQTGARSLMEWSAQIHTLHGLVLYNDRALLPLRENTSSP